MHLSFFAIDKTVGLLGGHRPFVLVDFVIHPLLVVIAFGRRYTGPFVPVFSQPRIVVLAEPQERQPVLGVGFQDTGIADHDQQGLGTGHRHVEAFLVRHKSEVESEIVLEQGVFGSDCGDDNDPAFLALKGLD